MFVSSLPLLPSFSNTKKLALSIAVDFHKNSLTEACYIFGKLDIRNLTPNIFKNQAKYILKLLGHNCNYQQGFVKNKCSPSLCFSHKIPYTILLRLLFSVNINNVTFVTENLSNIVSNIYVSTVSLFS